MLDTRALDDPEISALKTQLLSLLSSRGLVESEELIRRLGWNAESYGYIGKLLIDVGVLRADGKEGEKLERIVPVPKQAESGSQSAVTLASPVGNGPGPISRWQAATNTDTSPAD